MHCACYRIEQVERRQGLGTTRARQCLYANLSRQLRKGYVANCLRRAA
jgi:hypothetical protein